MRLILLARLYVVLSRCVDAVLINTSQRPAVSPEDPELAALSVAPTTDDSPPPSSPLSTTLEPSIDALLASAAQTPVVDSTVATVPSLVIATVEKRNPEKMGSLRKNTYRERHDINGTLLRQADVGNGFVLLSVPRASLLMWRK